MLKEISKFIEVKEYFSLTKEHVFFMESLHEDLFKSLFNSLICNMSNNQHIFMYEVVIYEGKIILINEIDPTCTQIKNDTNNHNGNIIISSRQKIDDEFMELKFKDNKIFTNISFSDKLI